MLPPKNFEALFHTIFKPAEEEELRKKSEANAKKIVKKRIVKKAKAKSDDQIDVDVEQIEQGHSNNMSHFLPLLLPSPLPPLFRFFTKAFYWYCRYIIFDPLPHLNRNVIYGWLLTYLRANSYLDWLAYE